MPMYAVYVIESSGVIFMSQLFHEIFGVWTYHALQTLPIPIAHVGIPTQLQS